MSMAAKSVEGVGGSVVAEAISLGNWNLGFCDFDLEAKFAGSISRYDSLLCVYKMRIQKSIFLFFLFLLM